MDFGLVDLTYARKIWKRHHCAAASVYLSATALRVSGVFISYVWIPATSTTGVVALVYIGETWKWVPVCTNCITLCI